MRPLCGRWSWRSNETRYSSHVAAAAAAVLTDRWMSSSWSCVAGAVADGPVTCHCWHATAVDTVPRDCHVTWRRRHDHTRSRRPSTDHHRSQHRGPRRRRRRRRRTVTISSLLQLQTQYFTQQHHIKPLNYPLSVSIISFSLSCYKLKTKMSS